MHACLTAGRTWKDDKDGMRATEREEDFPVEEAFLVDEYVSGLHVVLVNDWCICQPHSCGATISQPAEEESNGWKRAGEKERGKYGALFHHKKERRGEEEVK